MLKSVVNIQIHISPTAPIGNLPNAISKTPATVNTAARGSPMPLRKLISF